MTAKPNLPPVGTAGWMDLTVQDAPRIASFYEKVIGWKTQEVAMGTYSDFCMVPQSAEDPIAGVCHARGVNVGLPPGWLIYFIVANLDDSLQEVQSQGGHILRNITVMGQMGRYAVIADPSGASCALFEHAAPRQE